MPSGGVFVEGNVVFVKSLKLSPLKIVLLLLALILLVVVGGWVAQMIWLAFKALAFIAALALLAWAAVKYARRGN
ncbi:MAG TPA: hypothetical protein VJ841_03335 [Candidatus Saccharimonadales bacterium]|nr:hypothetical protein [Candidatus Saccharimonadales bacterium]